MYTSVSKIEDLPIGKITISLLHFERAHSEEGMTDLVNSLNDVGLIHPITVRKSGKVYELLAGKRRLECLKETGAKTARCTVLSGIDDYRAELLSIQENTNGTEPMSPQEQKRAVDRIVELTQMQIGKRQDKPDMARVGKTAKGNKVGEAEGRDVAAKTLNMSRTRVDRIRNLDNLCPIAKRAFENKQVTVQQAEMLTSMSVKEQQDKLPKMIRETQAQSRQRENIEKIGKKDPGHKVALRLVEKLTDRCKETLEITEALQKELTPELALAIQEQSADAMEALKAGLEELLGHMGDVRAWSEKRSG